MSARRKWALENAACALVVFGTIAGVLLFDSGSARAASAAARTHAVSSGEASDAMATAGPRE
jgi:hypothetical protein